MPEELSLQYEVTAWELGHEHSEMRSVIVRGQHVKTRLGSHSIVLCLTLSLFLSLSLLASKACRAIG